MMSDKTNAINIDKSKGKQGKRVVTTIVDGMITYHLEGLDGVIDDTIEVKEIGHGGRLQFALLDKSNDTISKNNNG